MISGTDPYAAWRQRLALGLVGCTLALLFIGGLVTSTGSGLAVPDWPLSYGMLMPPMVGGIFYEHGHRMAAAAVGLITLVLAVWTARAETRRAVRRLAWGALAVVVAQGLLGGLTVLWLLPTPVSVAHACLAQVFFCIVIALAYATSREWLASGRAAPADAAGVRAAAAAAVAVVFGQLLLGAVMRHLGAGLAIPDFPLAFGRLVPPLTSLGVTVHFAHRVGAVAVLVGIVALHHAARRTGDARLSRPAATLLVLTVGQAALGAATVMSAKAVLPATAHVAVGAAVLGGAWFLLLRSHRLLGPARASAPLRTNGVRAAVGP